MRPRIAGEMELAGLLEGIPRLPRMLSSLRLNDEADTIGNCLSIATPGPQASPEISSRHLLLWGRRLISSCRDSEAGGDRIGGLHASGRNRGIWGFSGAITSSDAMQVEQKLQSCHPLANRTGTDWTAHLPAVGRPLFFTLRLREPWARRVSSPPSCPDASKPRALAFWRLGCCDSLAHSASAGAIETECGKVSLCEGARNWLGIGCTYNTQVVRARESGTSR
ncbi:hypothetical protein B0T16DRAFT_181212 [Cercophora newfieldiana]|uniref:Uncharacterized protein n=1 Tax=Cercophora newfieldiana TaxID=92897 RepID=A0AA39Y030_9PEZI|nr:hypothetical protein B0T16DRAFT_181212 [Cercophora newfieldiana]